MFDLGKAREQRMTSASDGGVYAVVVSGSGCEMCWWWLK
jgi:hypothetical protein